MKILKNKGNDKKKLLLGVGALCVTLGIARLVKKRKDKTVFLNFEDEFSDDCMLDDDLNDCENIIYAESENGCEFCGYDPEENVNIYLDMTEEEKNEELRHTVIQVLDVLLTETLHLSRNIEKIQRERE